MDPPFEFPPWLPSSLRSPESLARQSYSLVCLLPFFLSKVVQTHRQLPSKEIKLLGLVRTPPSYVPPDCSSVCRRLIKGWQLGANGGITLNGIGLRILGVSNVIVRCVQLPHWAHSLLDEIRLIETSKSPRSRRLPVMRLEFRY